jgi:hypothetical protein
MSPLVPVFARQYRAIQGNTRQYAPRGKSADRQWCWRGSKAQPQRSGQGLSEAWAICPRGRGRTWGGLQASWVPSQSAYMYAPPTPHQAAFATAEVGASRREGPTAALALERISVLWRVPRSRTYGTSWPGRHVRCTCPSPRAKDKGTCRSAQSATQSGAGDRGPRRSHRPSCRRG